MRVITRNGETSTVSDREIVRDGWSPIVEMPFSPISTKTNSKSNCRKRENIWKGVHRHVGYTRSCVRGVRVESVTACSHCATLISFKTDGYLSDHMSLKWRAETSGAPFPFGNSVAFLNDGTKESIGVRGYTPRYRYPRSLGCGVSVSEAMSNKRTANASYVASRRDFARLPVRIGA